MKKTKVFFISLFLIILVGCSNNTISKNIKVKENENDFEKDAVELTKVLEDTHPAFVLNDIDKNYENVKKDYINSAKKDENLEDFAYDTKKYLTIFKDGHTLLFGNSTINNNFLNLDTYYRDNKLFILNKDKSISNKEIVKIGDINIDNIFNTVDDYVTSENISGERINKSIYSLNYKILEIAGANIENNALNVEIKEIDKTFNENVKFVEKDTYSVYENNSEIRSKNIDDIYYIKMNACVLNDSLEEEAKKLEDEIKKVEVR